MISFPIRNADQLFAIAYELAVTGMFQEAEKYYRKVIELEPEDPTPHFNLGNVFYSAGRYEAAIDSYRSAVELDDFYVEAWNNLGNAYCKLGKIAEARASLTHAVDRCSDYAEARYNLALTCLEMGRPNEAKFHLRLCLRASVDPELSDDVLRALKKVAGVGLVSA